MKIKVRTYYIGHNYNENTYSILYTGNIYVYKIAMKYSTKPLIKYTKKEVWWTIEKWQDQINNHLNNYKIKEISKEDVFLELL